MTAYDADCMITQSYVVKISDWRVRISDFCNLTYITPIELNTGSKAMQYKLSRLSLILTGLVGGVVLLASSGVYAGNEAGFFSSPSLAADEDRTPGAFQYTVVSYHEDEVDGVKPGTWIDNFGQLADENVALEEKSSGDSLNSSSSAPGTGIGMGVTPLFDTYGVIRASSNRDKSTYVALGFISDELNMDETGTSDSREESAFSYGFGVNSSSSNFEYMMSVDQENRDVTAIGMRFTSEF
jgi:hypothetical protein